MPAPLISRLISPCRAACLWAAALATSLATQALQGAPPSLRQARAANAPAQPSRDQELYRIRGVDEISVDIDIDFPAPPDSARQLLARRISDPRELRMEQGWSRFTVHWAATNFWHRPLYFEETLLERHGQSAGPLLQPVISGFHFFTTLPLLPYKMGLERPLDRIYTLGDGRPGNRTQPLRRRLPLEIDAAMFEAGAIVGLVLLLP